MLFPDCIAEGVTNDDDSLDRNSKYSSNCMEECHSALTEFERMENKADDDLINAMEQGRHVNNEEPATLDITTIVDDESKMLTEGLPPSTSVVARITYNKDVNWHLMERDNTDMNSLKLSADGTDISGVPIQSVSRFLTNSSDRIGRILTNPNMNLKKGINRKTALVLFNKIAEQFNMRKMGMLSRFCEEKIHYLVKKLWENDPKIADQESSVMPQSFYHYVHSWGIIDVYNSENKVDKYDATANYFNHHLDDVRYCIENKMNALTYITQMCTSAIFYSSNNNQAKYILALKEMTNGMMKGGEYYRGVYQWDQCTQPPSYHQQIVAQPQPLYYQTAASAPFLIQEQNDVASAGADSQPGIEI